jgi:GxxExxY protein
MRQAVAVDYVVVEGSYEACLCYELARSNIRFQQQLALPLGYNGEKLADVGYRIDLLVEGELIVEIKACDGIAPVHHAQLLSYLKLSGKKLGLLINFNVPVLKEGISRKVNGL